MMQGFTIRINKSRLRVSHFLRVSPFIAYDQAMNALLLANLRDPGKQIANGVKTSGEIQQCNSETT